MNTLTLAATVEVGNFWYFFFMGTGALGVVGLYFLLKNRSDRTKYWVLWGLLFLNFCLHFLKLAFQPYRSELPASLRKSTFENICAVSTLIFPWMFLCRSNKSLSAYLYFIGVVGGLAAHLYPTNAIGQPVFSFDTLRFYVNHWGLVAVPVVAALTGVIEIDYKKWWVIPLFFLAIEAVICVNEYIVWKLGWLNWEEWSLAKFLHRDYRNNSFVFGPDSKYDSVTGFIRVFVPEIFTKDVFLVNGGVDFYWPVVWMIVPALLYLPLFFLLLSLPFTFKNVKRDFLSWKERRESRTKTDKK